MEVIRLAGYTETRRFNIALRYLMPKQAKTRHPRRRVEITESGVRGIVRTTPASGVRCSSARFQESAARWSRHPAQAGTEKVVVVETTSTTPGREEVTDYGQAEKENSRPVVASRGRSRRRPADDRGAVMPGKATSSAPATRRT